MGSWPRRELTFNLGLVFGFRIRTPLARLVHFPSYVGPL